jgi:hypothetical protein
MFSFEQKCVNIVFEIWKRVNLQHQVYTGYRASLDYFLESKGSADEFGRQSFFRSCTTPRSRLMFPYPSACRHARGDTRSAADLLLG